MKDTYFYSNHMSIYECKLCLTIHNNKVLYLGHNQSKKHSNRFKEKKGNRSKT